MHRIGLAGFGSIAEHGHLPALQSFPGVEIVAVADLSPERLDCARKLLPDAVLYESPLDLIRRADLTAVDICTPPSTHADLIVAACERGLRDVVCEKPLVLSEEEYLRVARTREVGGSRVVSVNNWMHSDLNRHVSAALDSGAIGAVRSVELRTRRTDAALGNSGWVPRWRIDRSLAGGGIILDHGWHQLYLLLGWMRKPIEIVRATTQTLDRRHAPVEDEAVIDLEFASGTGRIELSWTARERGNDGCIQGTKGAITIRDDGIDIANGREMHTRPFAGRLTQSSYHPDWFQAMFGSTLLRDGRAEADQNFAEAGALVSAIEAAYHSAQEGGAPVRPSLR
jgi:predicted dehydrogenase